MTRRESMLLGGSALLTGCSLTEHWEEEWTDVTPPTRSIATRSLRRQQAQAEFQRTFVASGASLRFDPHIAHGRAWTSDLERGYARFRQDPKVAWAVQNLDTGVYPGEWQADELMVGGSMPKPAVSAVALDRYQGQLSRENFQHIVQVCDLSINASWKALNAIYNFEDEQRFVQNYALPPVAIRGNQQSPRFYSEFFRLCVDYRIQYGNELLLQAMRRSRFGRGRWYLPREITWIGGKTGTWNEWKHEGLWFRYGDQHYAIVVYTKGYFGRGENYWRMGALFGGLFREMVTRRIGN